jgi:WD40 repeat protein
MLSAVMTKPRPRSQFSASADFKSIFTLAATPDLNAIAFASGPNVQVWDAVSGKMSHELAGLTDGINAVTISADGKLVAAAGGPTQRAEMKYDDKTRKWTQLLTGAHGPGTAKVWELASGKELATLKSPTLPIGGVAISPDNRTIATTGYQEKRLRIWDATTGQQIAETEGEYVSPLFTPDGRRLVVHRWLVTDGQRIDETRVLDARTGVKALQIPRPQFALANEVISPDGRKLVRFGPAHNRSMIQNTDPTEVELINLTTGKIESKFTETEKRIVAVNFGPRSGQITTVLAERVIRVRDLATGKISATYETGVKYCSVARFARDGWRILLANSSVKDQFTVVDIRDLEPLTSP